MPFRTLLAFDPGTKGALAIFHDDYLHSVIRLPVTKTMPTKTRKGSTDLDLPQLIKELRNHLRANVGAAQSAVIEQVGVFGGGKAGFQSTTATAKLMTIYGEIRGICATLDIPVTLVTPMVWKRHHGLLKQPKEAACDEARRLHPWLVLDTKASADLADAVLIGEWMLSRGH